MTFESRNMNQGHAGSFSGHNLQGGCFSFIRPGSWRSHRAKESSSNKKATGTHCSSPLTCECTPKKAGGADYRRSSSPSPSTFDESIPSYRRPSSPSTDTLPTSMICDETARRPLQKVSALCVSLRRDTTVSREDAQPAICQQEDNDNAGRISTATHAERCEQCKCQVPIDLSEAMRKISLELASPTPRSPSALLRQRRLSSPVESLRREAWNGPEPLRSRYSEGDAGNQILQTPPRRSNENIILGDLERRKTGTYARRAELNARCIPGLERLCT